MASLFATRRTLLSRLFRLSIPVLHNQQPRFAVQPRLRESGRCYSKWNNPYRPTKSSILHDGRDFHHWLIVMEFNSNPKPTKEEMIDTFVKTLSMAFGSEEEAMKQIYSIRTTTTTFQGFGASISEEQSYKLMNLPGVLWVLPDSYLDVPKKDYGGDLFVDGKVIQRPEYR